MDEGSTSGGRRVRVASPLEQRLHRLEHNLEMEHTSRLRWKRAFAIMSVFAVVGIAVAAVAITVTSSSYSGVSGEAVTFDDTLFSVTPGGILVNALALSAQGATSGTAEEMGALLAEGRTALGAGNWTYQVAVAELSDGSVPTGTTYEAELYINGTSSGSIFFQQATDSAGVEALTLKWDIGNDLPSGQAYTVRITEV